MEKDQQQLQQSENEAMFSAPDVDFSMPGFKPPSLNLEAGGGFGGDLDQTPLQLTGKRKRNSDQNDDDGKVLKTTKLTPPKRERRSRTSKDKGLKLITKIAQSEAEEKKSTPEPNHDFYLPKDKKTTKKDNHHHFEYGGYEYGDNDKAEFSGSDDSGDESYTRRIHGRNLSFKNQEKVKKKRGKTHNTNGFVTKAGMNNSHLIGDQMKGSGHHFKRKNQQSQNGQNLIPTSDQYNKVIMSNMENQIKDVVGNRRFDLQVYTYYYETNDPEKISNDLKSIANSDVEEVSKEMKSVLKKSKTKRVKKLVYEVKFGNGDQEKKFKGELGADLALGTLDEESKKERKERKDNKDKKPRKVDLTQSNLITDLTEVEELWEGDASYRNAFNSTEETSEEDEVVEKSVDMDVDGYQADTEED